MNFESILIIDDNKELLLAFEMMLDKHFGSISTSSTPERIPHLLNERSYTVILLDMNFKAGVNTGNEGMFWLRKILESDPDASVILITAFGDVEQAVAAMSQGAVNFIQKSWDDQKILSTILSSAELNQKSREIRKLKDQKHHLNSPSNADKYYKGISKLASELYENIAKVAPTDATVLLLGENGTGKEHIARAVHDNSERESEIFVHVDIGSLMESLIESELFGYEPGAFTDAKSRYIGRFEVASGGTLFLDEIGNLSLSAQAKVLTAIQSKQITRLGSNKPVPVDFRLVCATNANLEEMVAQGTFRQDLMYRINTIQIEVPPLRSRMEDIEGLSLHFLSKFVNKYKKSGLSLSLTAIDKLTTYSWPGNIRELLHAIEKAVILSDSNVLTGEDFQFKSHTHLPNNNFSIHEHEQKLIKSALEYYDGNMTKTAQGLGINRSTLYDKIRKYEIE